MSQVIKGWAYRAPGDQRVDIEGPRGSRDWAYSIPGGQHILCKTLAKHFFFMNGDI